MFGSFVEQSDGQACLSHDNLVRIFHGSLHLVLELLEGVLPDNFRVTEPGSAGFDSGLSSGHDVGLERGRLDDLAVGITLGLGTPVHLETLDGSGGPGVTHTLGDIAGLSARVQAVVAAPFLVVRNLGLHVLWLDSFSHFEAFVVALLT